VPTLALTSTVLPLLVLAAVAVLTGAAVVRCLRDDAVLDALRAELRAMGEVRRAVHEVRSTEGAHPARR
jgi:hypothetical protein